jgi:FkbH-like protein
MHNPVKKDAFRTPSDLTVEETLLKRVALVGSCQIAGWHHAIELMQPGCHCDFMQWGVGVTLPPDPPVPAENYDFQIVQLPIATLIPTHTYFRLSYADVKAYEDLFETAKSLLKIYLRALMAWNVAHGLPTFVCNFLVPQQNPMGRLLPRADLRNMVYFVEKLNEALALEVQTYSNAYLLDIDSIAAVFGRRRFQDDALWQLNHGTALVNNDEQYDTERLELVGSVHNVYEIDLLEYLNFFWHEMIAMYRTLKQVDAIKIVIFDLDDTLWRGVAAERPDGMAGIQAGWPMGLAEAVGYLKRRGILLAIVSKNSRETIERLWPLHYSEQDLSLQDFVVRKINWAPKPQNIEEVLREVNLLPRNALFIDDNPVERAAVKEAFPDMRMLGCNHYLWRRILLWASETQVATVTQESANRTQMIHAQIEREATRREMPREEWLQSLDLHVNFFAIAGTDDPRFPRTFELLNKTNQFNTTGRRWSMPEMTAALQAGLRLFAIEAKDKHTNYGLTAVAVVEGAQITQFVMSCRVVGLDVELASIGAVLRAIGPHTTTALFVKTNANLLCRDLFARCGFVEEPEDFWVRNGGDDIRLAHIALTESGSKQEVSHVDA